MTVLSLYLRAVIFDMDGVITNTMPDHFRAWEQVLNDEGIEISQLEIYQNEGQKGSLFLRELFERLGYPPDESRQRDILARKEAVFKDIVELRFVDGACELVRDLHDGGFDIALVTGTSGHEVQRILPAELRARFTVIVTADDVAQGKPHPEPFSRALSMLGIAPKDAVAVENAPLGIASANAAGLTTLALETSLPKEYLKAAHRIFPTIRELRRAVNFVNTGESDVTGHSARL